MEILFLSFQPGKARYSVAHRKRAIGKDLPKFHPPMRWCHPLQIFKWEWGSNDTSLKRVFGQFV